MPPGCWGGPPSAPSRLSPTASSCSPSDRTTGTSMSSPSGTTSAPSTDAPGAGTSTSSAEDSPARTSAVRVRARDLQALAADSGSRCCESLAKSNLHMSSPKTPRICVPADWMSSSKGLPAWGMMSLGVCWALGTSAPRIDVTECGSLLPTPTGAGNEGSPSMQKWPAHRALAGMMATPTASGSDARNTNRPSARATRAMLPTCRASDAEKGGRGELLAVVRGKSPRKRDAHLYLPTPTAQLYGYNRGGAAGRAGKERPSLEVLTGGVFIALREWMMGMPIGWTASARLETHRFQQWLCSHGAR